MNILVLNSNNRLHPYLACLSTEHHITAISSVDHPQMVGLFKQGQPDLCVVDVSDNQAWHGLAVGKEVRRIYEPKNGSWITKVCTTPCKCVIDSSPKR